MIVDFRTYTLTPGALGAYLKAYGADGYPLQQRYLPACLGYYYVDIGVQNQVVHFWRYDDIADRARRRAAMEADAAWNAYRARSAQYLQAQDNQILRPVPFWPIKPSYEGPASIVDLRIYRLHPGKAGEMFRLYENQGLETQIKHLGRSIGYYVSDIGPQNVLVHLWAYEDLNERHRRRQAMAGDPAWQTYLAHFLPLVQRMENSILRPAPFWQIPTKV